MYIRQISRKRPDGTKARYLQLAHKVRDPESGVPRDEVLYHFGPEDSLDRAQLKRLALSLSRFLEPADQGEVQALVEGTRLEERLDPPRSLGGVYLLDRLWERLGVREVLGELLGKRSYAMAVERVLFALVANRALAPGSKLAIEEWVAGDVHVEGLPEVGVHQLYRAMDFLLEGSEKIQEAVYFRVASLLNLEVDLLFFDTTSTCFEIEEEDDEDAGIRRFGYSRDRRPDLPQVVIGLAVTRDGIPVRVWTWPGNKSDATTVAEVQRDLAGWRLNRVVWVMDRGMAGEEQRLALQRGGGHVIVGERLRSGSKEAEAAMKRAGRYETVRDNLEVKKIEIGEGTGRRTFVVVRNPQEAERDRERRAKHLEQLGAEIERLNGQKRRGAKHTKAVCALKTHATLGRWVVEQKNGKLRVDRAKVRADAKLDGKYLLTTTDPALSAEEVALGYRQLQEVERAFRTFKSTLDLRPVYHRLEDRIRSHVVLCWLALLMVRVVERDGGLSWERARRMLGRIARVRFRTKEGAVEVVPRLTEEQRKLFQDLEIQPPKPVQHVEIS